MRKTAREYLLAVQAFSRIPLAASLVEWAGRGAIDVRESAAHLPGVGLLLGMAACVAFALASLLLPDTALAAFAAAAICTGATLLLGGAMHERELAAFARRAAMAPDAAPIAIALALPLKFALLATIAAQSPGGVLVALLGAHAVSRFWMLLLAAGLPFAEEGTVTTALFTRMERRSVRLGALWCVLPLVLMGAVGRIAFMVVALAASALAFWAMRSFLRRRFGGFTGDALGATQQACELAFYLGAGVAIGGR